jgi:putative acetyltransferase
VTYTIVPARPADVARLPAIALAAAWLLAAHAPASVLAEQTDENVLRCAQREGRLWVALANDRPVGFAHVELLEPEVAHLEELDVHPEHGRRGLGRRLVSVVCHWAAEREYRAVTLTTFRNVPWNMPFYARLGFEELPPREQSAAIRAIVDDEARRGLDPAARVVMWRHSRRPSLSLPSTYQSMRVRRANPDDRAQLVHLWERAVRATHDFLTEADIAALRPLVAAELASDATVWWVLVSPHETPLGFLGLAGDTIEALFVDPDSHRRGGGSLLVAHAQSLASGPLLVDVNEQNESARRFYERLGFVVIGRSQHDGAGRPFPLLHMRRDQISVADYRDIGPARETSRMEVRCGSGGSSGSCGSLPVARGRVDADPEAIFLVSADSLSRQYERSARSARSARSG